MNNRRAAWGGPATNDDGQTPHRGDYVNRRTQVRRQGKAPRFWVIETQSGVKKKSRKTAWLRAIRQGFGTFGEPS